MQRVAVLGNSGGGKSTLSRQLAARFDLPWWLLDGLGMHDSIAARLARATHVILVFRLTSVEDLDGFLARTDL